MTSLKSKILLPLLLTCFITGVAIPSSTHAATPFKNCALFFKKLFVSEPRIILEPPAASKIYPANAEALIEMGELQRAIWNSNNKALEKSVQDFLKTAKIISEEPTLQGITGAKKLTLEGTLNNKVIRIHINAIQKTMGYENEVAFYELEKLFELDLSPVTVERMVKDKKVSLQLFIDDAVSAEDLNRLKRGDHESMSLDMMDYLAANYDRSGNYLITLDQHRVVSIDAGFAFTGVKPASMKPYKLAGTLDEKAEKFFQKLKQSSDHEITETLKIHLSASAISDVLKRKKNLIEFMEKNYGL